MKKFIYVGMDVHKDSIAVVEGQRNAEVRLHGNIGNSLITVERLVRKLQKSHLGYILRVVYEAGPCGYVIYRRLSQLGIDCMVTAPSLKPEDLMPREGSN
jgi:transposase